ncbi:hypothetical protein A3D66_00190 [Candidatus Kaiserbacteria bacterium RIFCSPHIGHO2_02_FULL_50_9]|uniref:Nudix hydrolase domain-containing protein n=1 Tax=Candidatus Kaiserbacteria bacterium RIFCSPLOWO2_01_FULL_51_21 TaxID=1798508 RepID=A0A1F6EDK2_9BACT|nr:MAG: hypothetical protein A2761_00430 [Candidatus Kaiserbacteria bacterium RIFCSPHIGHO2_01_FULL_51_33]OGG63131.1 MAG: hypothetical protein A3D66_00190 [Candidatus Kaiserbacteria bacterium RIFCSPHIGHO2_02_FULL_50_9]OGG71759.1 MAG: hypothetical protein A3A35_01855 [Candidatus Kaiserbacteria bacterium RIFCSPLOWO2_01_FULL_51_21]
MRQNTLIFLIDQEENEILLGMKKRGFGAGKLNGYGGKVNKGETITASAVREVMEEAEVEVAEKDLVKAAEILFYFNEHPDWNVHCFVYLCYHWRGEPKETEEMAPEWHDLEAIPYDKTWSDDQYWLPKVLAGDFLTAEFHFNGKGESFSEYTIHGVKKL